MRRKLSRGLARHRTSVFPHSSRARRSPSLPVHVTILMVLELVNRQGQKVQKLHHHFEGGFSVALITHVMLN